MYTTDTLVKLNNIFVGIQPEAATGSDDDTDSDVDGVDIESAKSAEIDGKSQGIRKKPRIGGFGFIKF